MFTFFNTLLFIFLFKSFSWNEIDAKVKFYLKSNYSNKNTVLSDMPGKDDMPKYVEALESITEFSKEHVKDLDAEYLISLFFVNVQLQHTLLNNKNDSESHLFTPKIHYIVETNERLFVAFTQNAQSNVIDNPLKNLTYRLFASLENATVWASRLNDLNFDLLSRDNDTKHKDLLFEYPNWTDYMQAINDYTEHTPTPLKSESCMVPLMTHKKIRRNKMTYKQCAISESCRDMVLTGNSYGFHLTRRLMYMLLAHLGQRCCVFDSSKDLEMRNMLCAIMYVEASYIASNGFQLPELIFEQMSLCALDGHAQFLRRSWLDKLLTQMNSGCFFPLDQTGICDMRTTAQASSAIAAAIRFAAEKGDSDQEHDPDS